MPGYSSALNVTVDGAPLDPLIARQLIQVTVDTSLYLPDLVVLTFRDPQRTVIEAGGFDFGVVVTVEGQTADSVGLLAETAVSAVEIDADHEGALTVIRCLDASAKAMRGTKTRIFQEMALSEIAAAVATEAGLVPGDVTDSPGQIPYLLQPNISDWDFIQLLAKRAGFVAWTSRGTFNFGLLPPAEAAGPPGTPAIPPTGTQLVLGRNLFRLRGRVTASGQVEAVVAQGWDPLAATPFVSPGTVENTGVLSTPPAAGLVADVAGELLTVASGLSQLAEVEGLALGTGAALAAAAVTFEGEAEGNPLLLAGVPCSIGNAGPPFDGQYVLTGARHIWDGRRQYRTEIAVSAHDDSVLGLASAPAGDHPGRLGGVVCATVIDNNDPDEQGSVKVQFGWMGETAVSAWARTVYPGASKGFGTLFIPELGDEVLVGFEHGDPNRPYVLGALHGPVNPAGAEGVVDGGVVTKRQIVSAEQHQIVFEDGPEESGIRIVTGDETISIVLNAEEGQLQISCQGGQIEVTGATISVTADTSLRLAAGENSVTLSDSGVAIMASALQAECEGEISLTGQGVMVAGEESVAVSSASVTLGA